MKPYKVGYTIYKTALVVFSVITVGFLLLFLIPEKANSSGMSDRVFKDPQVERFLGDNIVYDPRSALTLDGKPIRMLCKGEHCGNHGIKEVPQVPLPMSLYMLVAGLFGFAVVKYFPQSLIDRIDR